MECSFLQTVDVKRSSHICVFEQCTFGEEIVNARICRLCKSEKSKNSCSPCLASTDPHLGEFHEPRCISTQSQEFVFLGVFLRIF